MKITTTELKEILELHQKWLRGEAGGQRANLRSANLSYANLRSANLSYANLRSANLSCADLSTANPSTANLRGADLRNTAEHDAVAQRDALTQQLEAVRQGLEEIRDHCSCTELCECSDWAKQKAKDLLAGLHEASK